MSDQRPPEPGEQPPGPGQPTYEPYSAQPQYGPPQQPAYGYGPPALPDHPQASTAFALGLVSLIGGFFCLLPLAAGPFAWVTGARARAEIDRGQQYGGRDKATAGMVMGIVATGLLGLIALVIIGAVVVIAAAAGA